MSEINYALDDLLQLMSRLREPEYGCPWDLAQSYKSIVASTLEEAYEVADAIEQGDYAQLKEELGDLLFQIIFYSQLGKEEDRFDFHDIVSSITQKLLRRHPHVFPDGTLASRIKVNGPDDAGGEEEKSNKARQEQIKAQWEQIKSEERQQKGHVSVLDDVPVALPSSVRALKLQKRAASVNFDWSDIQGVYDKIDEEIREVRAATENFEQYSNTNNPESAKAKALKGEIEEELGDLLFTVVNLSRHLKVDPETALRRANHKFEARFRCVESLAQEQSKALAEQSADTLEAWWQQAKHQLSKEALE